MSWQRAGSEAAGIIRELEQEYEALQTRYHVLATTIQRQGAGEALAEGASPEVSGVGGLSYHGRTVGSGWEEAVSD